MKRSNLEALQSLREECLARYSDEVGVEWYASNPLSDERCNQLQEFITKAELLEKFVREMDTELMKFFKEKNYGIPIGVAAPWLEIRDLLNGRVSPHE